MWTFNIHKYKKKTKTKIMIDLYQQTWIMISTTHKNMMDKHKTQKIMLKNGQNVNLIKNTNDKKTKKYISFCVSCLRP